MKIVNPKTEKFLDQIVESQLLMALETEDLKLDKSVLTEGVKSILLNSTRGKYYLAFSDDDKFMGMLLATPEWSDWRAKDILWINSVYIHKDFRGQGVYKKLYEYIKTIVLESDNYAGLRLYVDKTNQNAIKVYKQLGMSDDHYSLYEWMKP